MMNRPLSLMLLAAATAVAGSAEAAGPYGGATMKRPALQSDPLGPRSDPTVTVAQAVARTQIEQRGYTSVRGLTRADDGTWHGMARNASNKPVGVVLDNQGRVTESQ
jgi:hypothetical protein